jgi:flagellar biogenesis protein FliO
MDLLSLFRTIGGLGAVLGILAGALWLVRRYDLRLPGRAIGAR